MSAPAASPARATAHRTYTLMQFIMAMSVLAAVAVWAIPIHQRSLRQQTAAAAARDLSSLQELIDQELARGVLPQPSDPALAPATTVALMQQPYASGWQPSAGQAFEFGATFDAGGYALTASGRPGYACRLSVVRTLATPQNPAHALRTAQGADCGFQTW